MKKTTKKLSALLLSLIMIIASLPITSINASAANYTTIETAKSISFNTKYSGNITSDDATDYYKFEITSSSTVNLNFVGDMDYVYIYLFDSEASQLLSHSIDRDNSGQCVLNTDFVLTKGVYYLKVSNEYSYGNYSFKLTAESANETFQETTGGTDNTIDDANIISLDKTYKGQIAFNDSTDFYKFEITSSSTVNFNFIGDMDYIYIYLFDSEFSQITGNSIDKNSAGQCVLNKDLVLTKGVYYLKVSNEYSYGNYSFKLTAKSANETFQETTGGINNTIGTANKISIDKTYNGQIALNDYTDFYKFEITSSSKLNLNFVGDMDYIYIYLYNSESSQLSNYSLDRNNSGRCVLNTDLELAKGVYYIKVSNEYSYGNYYFSITTPSSAPNNDINSDGKITIVDAKWILQNVADLKNFNATQKAAADLNKDGKVTIVDAKWVLQIVADLRDAKTLKMK